MKRTLLMLVTILCATLMGADEAVQVPKGITYVPTTDKINDAARESLKQRFKAEASDEDVHALFENMLICGPGLWPSIKDDENIAKIKQGRMISKLPVLKPDGKLDHFNDMEGKIFQTPEQVLVFWKALVKQSDLGNLTIRKLNPLELRMYWALISWNIGEPVFVLESDKHRFVVQFMDPRPEKPDEKLRIMWIDDFERFIRKQEAARTADADK